MNRKGWCMTNSFKQLTAYAQSILTFAMFIAIAYWGHQTHWQFTTQHSHDHSVGDEHATPPETNSLSMKGAVGPAQHGVQLEPARQETVRYDVPATAVIAYNGQRYSQVSTRAPGHVQQVFVRVGQNVSQGQVLALVDSREVGEAKSSWLQKLMTVQYQRRVLERLQAIGDGAIALSKIRSAESDLRMAEVECFVAQQRLVNLGFSIDLDLDLNASLDELASRVRYLDIPAELASSEGGLPATANLIAIRAPFDGVVVEQHAVPGEMVSADTWQFVIADMSTMWVKLAVRREDASRLSVGQEVVFHADGVAEPIRTRLAWINPEIDVTTQTIQAGCEIRNLPANPATDSSSPSTGYLLQANQFGRAMICVDTRSDAVVVPATAIQRMPDLSYVAFVAKGPDAQAYEHRQIRLGKRHNGTIEIVEGIRPGEHVVTQGSFILKSELMKAALAGG